MANDNQQDDKALRDAFVKHLEEASRTVRSWPEWKQSIWGAPHGDSSPSQSLARHSESRKRGDR